MLCVSGRGSPTYLIEQHASGRGQGVPRPHALQVQQERLAELVQRVVPRKQQLVVDDPRGEVVGPLPLVQGNVHARRTASPHSRLVLHLLDVVDTHLKDLRLVQFLGAVLAAVGHQGLQRL